MPRGKAIKMMASKIENPSAPQNWIEGIFSCELFLGRAITILDLKIVSIVRVRLPCTFTNFNFICEQSFPENKQSLGDSNQSRIANVKCHVLLSFWDLIVFSRILRHVGILIEKMFRFRRNLLDWRKRKQSQILCKLFCDARALICEILLETHLMRYSDCSHETIDSISLSSVSAIDDVAAKQLILRLTKAFHFVLIKIIFLIRGSEMRNCFCRDVLSRNSFQVKLFQSKKLDAIHDLIAWNKHPNAPASSY